jgi:hypothetical protein
MTFCRPNQYIFIFNPFFKKGKNIFKEFFKLYKPSNKISSCKDILRIDCLLDSLYHCHSSLPNTSVQKFLSKLSNTMMVWNASTMLQNFVSGCVFNLTVSCQRICKSLSLETKVDINDCSSVVDLNMLEFTWVTREERKGYFLMPCFLH